MAKKKVACPFCGDKHEPAGTMHPNHVDPQTQALCPMSTRPVQGQENEGPVTDGGTSATAG